MSLRYYLVHTNLLFKLGFWYLKLQQDISHAYAERSHKLLPTSMLEMSLKRSLTYF